MLDVTVAARAFPTPLAWAYIRSNGLELPDANIAELVLAGTDAA